MGVKGLIHAFGLWFLDYGKYTLIAQIHLVVFCIHHVGAEQLFSVEHLPFIIDVELAIGKIESQ